MKRECNSKQVMCARKGAGIHLRRSLISLLVLFLAINLHAQTRQLNGVVKDPAGETVPGAAIRVLNTTKGAATDVD
mgnify:FL=1